MNQLNKAMEQLNKSSMNAMRKFAYSTMLVATLLLMAGCDNEDPKPVNEEEVITTVRVTLTGTGLTPVTLLYKDPDGDAGSAPAQVTVSGSLKQNSTYSATIQLLNETKTPVEDITEEVEEESAEHLFCFTKSASLNVTITATDQDANGRPIGLTSSWVTGPASQGTVTVALRHQPGTKNGQCPGGGETDIEVQFGLTIVP